MWCVVRCLSCRVSKFVYCSLLDPGFAASLLVSRSRLVADRGDWASPLAHDCGQLQARCRGTGSSGTVVGHRGGALPIHLSDLWIYSCHSSQLVSKTTATTKTTQAVFNQVLPFFSSFLETIFVRGPLSEPACTRCGSRDDASSCGMNG